MSKDPKCEDLVNDAFESRIEDLRKLWDLYMEDSEACDDELGHIYEYGLGFWYTKPNTYQNQKEGWFTYQLSTGGPGEEFRFFCNPDLSLYRIEFWYLNWFDGAKVNLVGKDFDFMEDFFECMFVDSQEASQQVKEAL